MTLRIFERGRLADIGLQWTGASRRNLALGLLGGIGAALIVLLVPIAVRVADIVPAPNEPARRMAADLINTIRAFEALRGTLVFEDEPSSFEAALLEAKE